MMNSKPTAAHRACIAELVIRFPCPRDTDPDSYAARAEMLAHDCAMFQPSLLRAACDRVATRVRWLPSACDIHEEVKAILEQRTAARAAAAGRSAHIASVDSMLREKNLQLIARGSPHRWAIVNGKSQTVTCFHPKNELVGDVWVFKEWQPSSQLRCNGDGSVTIAEWDPVSREWFFPTRLPDVREAAE